MQTAQGALFYYNRIEEPLLISSESLYSPPPHTYTLTLLKVLESSARRRDVIQKVVIHRRVSFKLGALAGSSSD